MKQHLCHLNSLILVNLCSPDEESYYVFLTWNNCREFLASDGAVFQRDHQSYFKKPVWVGSLLYITANATSSSIEKVPIFFNIDCFLFRRKRNIESGSWIIFETKMDLCYFYVRWLRRFTQYHLMAKVVYLSNFVFYNISFC